MTTKLDGKIKREHLVDLHHYHMKNGRNIVYKDDNNGEATADSKL